MIPNGKYMSRGAGARVGRFAVESAAGAGWGAHPFCCTAMVGIKSPAAGVESSCPRFPAFVGDGGRSAPAATRGFQHQGVRPLRPETLEHSTDADRRAHRFAGVAVLRPDEVHGVARLPLPAEDDDTAEGADVGVAVREPQGGAVRTCFSWQIAQTLQYRP